jgi:hypothetical protein
VWCETAAANFGEILIPATLEGLGVVATEDGPALECSEEAMQVSSPVLLGNLTTRAHEVAGVVYLLSESVIEIEVRVASCACNFHQRTIFRFNVDLFPAVVQLSGIYLRRYVNSPMHWIAIFLGLAIAKDLLLCFDPCRHGSRDPFLGRYIEGTI